MKFKDRLKEIRQSNQLTQKEFAKKMGYTRTAISAWEIGRNEPSYEDLKKISKFFGVSVDFLLGNESYVDLKNYNNLTEEQKKEVEMFVDFLKIKRNNNV